MTINKFHSDHEEALRYKSTTLQSWPVQQHPPRDTSIMLSWHSFIMCLSCVFYKGLSALHCCDYDQLIIARINNSTAAASSSWSINPWMNGHPLYAKGLCMLSIHRVWCTHSSCMCTKHRTLSLNNEVCCDCSCLMMHDRYDIDRWCLQFMLSI